MTAMRVKRMRRVWQVLGALAVEVVKDDCSVAVGARLYGREGPELEYTGATREIELRRRPWLQRFVRSYLGWRQHLGIAQSLRAAWRMSRIRVPARPAAAAPRAHGGRDGWDVSGGQLSEG